MKLLNRASEHIFWRIDRKKRLIIFGCGDIPEYAPASGYRNEPPWKGLEFNEVVIGKGITDVPPTALAGIDLDAVILAGAERRRDGLEMEESGLYNHRRKKLLLASNQKRVAILEGTVDVHPFAFAFHQKVETVECPSSLQRIGVSAFEGCKKLRSIYRLPADAVIGSKALKGTSGVRVYFDRYHVKRKLCEFYPRTAITKHGRGFLMNGEFTFFASEDSPNIDPTKFYRYQDLIDIKGGDDFLLGLRANGEVVYEEFRGVPERRRVDFEECFQFDRLMGWKNIVQIDAAGDVAAGLSKDGTVFCTKAENEDQPLENLTDIISIQVKDGGINAVRSDWTVVQI